MKYKYKSILTFPDNSGYYWAAGGETVHQEDKTPVKIGLLDQYGTPIYRVPDALPLGFDLSVQARKN